MIEHVVCSLMSARTRYAAQNVHVNNKNAHLLMFKGKSCVHVLLKTLHRDYFYSVFHGEKQQKHHHVVTDAALFRRTFTDTFIKLPNPT